MKQSIYINWMRIIFWYSSILNCFMISSHHDHLALRSTCRRHLLSVNVACFKLDNNVFIKYLTEGFVYSYIYMATHLSILFQTGVHLMLKPFRVSVWRHPFIFVCFYYHHDIVQCIFSILSMWVNFAFLLKLLSFEKKCCSMRNS